MSRIEETSRFDGVSEGIGETVEDPHEYNRLQRFKEIHHARQKVAKFLSDFNVADDGVSYKPAEGAKLGYLVSLYIYELEPLIIQSGIDDSELVPESLPYDSLRQFANSMGMKKAGKKLKQPKPGDSMKIYSAANQFYAMIGMDLKLKENSGDAGFKYSDILEEGPPNGGEFPEIEGVDR